MEDLDLYSVADSSVGTIDQTVDVAKAELARVRHAVAQNQLWMQLEIDAYEEDLHRMEIHLQRDLAPELLRGQPLHMYSKFIVTREDNDEGTFGTYTKPSSTSQELTAQAQLCRCLHAMAVLDKQLACTQECSKDWIETMEAEEKWQREQIGQAQVDLLNNIVAVQSEKRELGKFYDAMLKSQTDVLDKYKNVEFPPKPELEQAEAERKKRLESQKVTFPGSNDGDEGDKDREQEPEKKKKNQGLIHLPGTSIGPASSTRSTRSSIHHILDSTAQILDAMMDNVSTREGRTIRDDYLEREMAMQHGAGSGIDSGGSNPWASSHSRIRGGMGNSDPSQDEPLGRLGSTHRRSNHTRTSTHKRFGSTHQRSGTMNRSVRNSRRNSRNLGGGVGSLLGGGGASGMDNPLGMESTRSTRSMRSIADDVTVETADMPIVGRAMEMMDCLDELSSDEEGSLVFKAPEEADLGTQFPWRKPKSNKSIHDDDDNGDDIYAMGTELRNNSLRRRRANHLMNSNDSYNSFDDLGAIVEEDWADSTHDPEDPSAGGSRKGSMTHSKGSMTHSSIDIRKQMSKKELDLKKQHEEEEKRQEQRIAEAEAKRLKAEEALKELERRTQEVERQARELEDRRKQLEEEQREREQEEKRRQQREEEENQRKQKIKEEDFQRQTVADAAERAAEKQRIEKEEKRKRKDEEKRRRRAEEELLRREREKEQQLLAGEQEEERRNRAIEQERLQEEEARRRKKYTEEEGRIQYEDSERLRRAESRRRIEEQETREERKRLEKSSKTPKSDKERKRKKEEKRRLKEEKTKRAESRRRLRKGEEECANEKESPKRRDKGGKSVEEVERMNAEKKERKEARRLQKEKSKRESLGTSRSPRGGSPEDRTSKSSSKTGASGGSSRKKSAKESSKSKKKSTKKVEKEVIMGNLSMSVGKGSKVAEGHIDLSPGSGQTSKTSSYSSSSASEFGKNVPYADFPTPKITNKRIEEAEQDRRRSKSSYEEQQKKLRKSLESVSEHDDKAKSKKKKEKREKKSRKTKEEDKSLPTGTTMSNIMSAVEAMVDDTQPSEKKSGERRKKEKKSKRRGLDEHIRKSKRDPSKNLRGSRSLGENMKKSGAQRDKSCGASYAGDGLNSSGHSKPIQSSISSQGMLNLIEQQKWSIPSKKPSTRNI